MKKCLGLFMAIALIVSLAGCAPEREEQEIVKEPVEEIISEETQETVTDEDTTEDTEDISENSTEEKNGILIAYFTAAENSDVEAIASASVVVKDDVAKGSVQTVADMIQKGTGGDLFSIQTEFDYPGNIGKLIEYAAGEQERNERPALITHIENLDDYDVIFIGYPNWWYDMPMALYTFFEEYDFAGKTIIPFNTHRGSRFSSTISTIQELEPEATVITDGFTFPGDDAADAEEDVAKWLENLEY